MLLALFSGRAGAQLPAAVPTAGRYIRAVAVFAPGPVKQYDKFEVGLTLDRAFVTGGPNGNPYDPEDVSVAAYFTSPSGKVHPARYGFYYQDFVIRPQYLAANDSRYWDASGGTPMPWRIRFAPDEPGTWQYVLRVDYRDSTSETLPARTFACVASTNKGFLQVAPNKRNLVFDTGQSFFAIGSNVDYWGDIPLRVPAAVAMLAKSSAVPNLERCGPAGSRMLVPPASARGTFSTYTYSVYDQVFGELQANGGNFARVWLHANNFDMEVDTGSLGNYATSQRRMYDLDRVLRSARAHGIYLHLSLLDGIRLGAINDNAQWLSFPYKTGLGLRDTVPLDFFTDARARKFFKNRIRYIVARWGYSANVASYELVNEGDFARTGSLFLARFRADFPILVDWTHDMASYLKSLDRRHLQTLAYGPENSLEIMRAYPELFDYSTSHFYSSSFNAELQRNYRTQQQTRRLGMPYQLQEYDFAPYINTEYQSKFHSTPWATAFSGAFGIGLTLSAFANLHHPCWPAYSYYRPLARFLALAHFSSTAANVPIGNSAAAALELYGHSYRAKLVQDPELFIKLPAPADSAYNPAYSSPCDRACPPGWPASVGVAPQNRIIDLEADQYNQPAYLVGGITMRDARTGSTSANALIEVFALQNDASIVGWVHNKTHYWYNLPHTNFSICNPLTDPACAGSACATCSINPALGTAPITNRPGPHTITPLRNQELVVEGLSCEGTYRVQWFYTYPGLDVDRNGATDDGGLMPGLTQPAVPVVNGHLVVVVPPLVALGTAGPTSAPDYAFLLTKNNDCAVASPVPIRRAVGLQGTRKSHR
jgi:hypothetical protein